MIEIYFGDKKKISLIYPFYYSTTSLQIHINAVVSAVKETMLSCKLLISTTHNGLYVV